MSFRAQRTYAQTLQNSNANPQQQQHQASYQHHPHPTHYHHSGYVHGYVHQQHHPPSHPHQRQNSHYNAQHSHHTLQYHQHAHNNNNTQPHCSHPASQSLADDECVWQQVPIRHNRSHSHHTAAPSSVHDKKAAQRESDRAARMQHDRDNGRDAVVSVIACILEQLFMPRDTDTLPSDPALITMFHTERAPGISISEYLHRLAKYAECSSEALIQSIININRILHHKPNFIINSLNIHRLLLTSLLCSAKFFDDTYFNNSYYAKVGGIGAKELNCLEVEFLALINFDLFVQFPVYEHFYSELRNPKLHSNCMCKHDQMPQLQPEEFYHPSIAKEAEPLWDMETMIKMYSLSPKVQQRSLQLLRQEKEAQVEGKDGNIPIINNSTVDISQSGRHTRSSHSLDVMAVMNPPRSVLSIEPKRSKKAAAKRISPSVASTADSSAAQSASVSAAGSCCGSDIEDNNVEKESHLGSTSNKFKPAHVDTKRKAKKAKRNKNRLSDEAEVSVVPVRSAAIAVPSKSSKKNKSQARQQDKLDYQTELAETRQAMDTLSIDKKTTSPLPRHLVDSPLINPNTQPLPISTSPENVVGMSDSPPAPTRRFRTPESTNSPCVDPSVDVEASSNPFFYSAAHAFSSAVSIAAAEADLNPLSGQWAGHNAKMFHSHNNTLTA